VKKIKAVCYTHLVLVFHFHNHFHIAYHLKEISDQIIMCDKHCKSNRLKSNSNFTIIIIVKNVTFKWNDTMAMCV
jgi:hypothetical protein